MTTVFYYCSNQSYFPAFQDFFTHQKGVNLAFLYIQKTLQHSTDAIHKLCHQHVLSPNVSHSAAWSLAIKASNYDAPVSSLAPERAGPVELMLQHEMASVLV